MSESNSGNNAASHDHANQRQPSTMSNALARARGMLTYSQRQVDRVVPPPTRQRVIDSTTAFAEKRPLLSLLIAVQILSALVPVLLFTTFVLNTLLFALFSAIAFTLFWTLVALLFLVPTLLVTGGFSVLLWLWVVGSYVVARGVYARLPPSTRQTLQNLNPYQNTNNNDAEVKKNVIFHHDYDLDDAIAAEVAAARA
ncbi:hypothetical protein F5Y08DRAFT_9105 [Xylaria arbuscula]|nr:hypothetical protein F5Y08DRAFT_9105 [Xylaria arbuscula]